MSSSGRGRAAARTRSRSVELDVQASPRRAPAPERVVKSVRAAARETGPTSHKTGTVTAVSGTGVITTRTSDGLTLAVPRIRVPAATWSPAVGDVVLLAVCDGGQLVALGPIGYVPPTV